MKLNVIVIDDSVVQLALSSKLIEKNKHLNLVGTFTNPFLGLSVINKEDVDLVLLDIEMPEIDGFSLQKLFKDSVEVIMNSSKPSFELSAYTNGAIDFMSKPLSAPRLERSISRIFELRKILAIQELVVSSVGS